MYRRVLDYLQPYKPGKSIDEIKKQYGLSAVVKLASNENPYGCSKRVKEALGHILDIERYPDNNCTELREKLAQKLNVKQSNLIFGNGSAEIIGILSRALLEVRDEVITCVPTFPIYEAEALIANAVMIKVPLKNHRFDLNEILNHITDKTKLIYICNPNNPTGTMITEEEQRAFLDQVPENIFVVLDEAYYEYVYDKTYPDSIPLLEQYPNIAILRTFSKAYGLASFRIGYGIAGEEVINHLEKVRNPFNTTSISQTAAQEALEDEAFLTECVQRNKEVLEDLYQRLDVIRNTIYQITC